MSTACCATTSEFWCFGFRRTGKCVWRGHYWYCIWWYKLYFFLVFLSFLSKFGLCLFYCCYCRIDGILIHQCLDYFQNGFVHKKSPPPNFGIISHCFKNRFFLFFFLILISLFSFFLLFLLFLFSCCCFSFCCKYLCFCWRFIRNLKVAWRYR